jgi:hypothetical protein
VVLAASVVEKRLVMAKMVGDVVGKTIGDVMGEMAMAKDGMVLIGAETRERALACKPG